MYGKIYLITNSINDKVYVGQTIQSVSKRFSSHKSSAKAGQAGALYNAMRKHGVENFQVEILEDNIKASALDCAEIEYIKKYNSFKKGYNNTIGGEGTSFYDFTDEERLDIGLMYEEKNTMTPICKKYNVSRSVIYNVLEELKVLVNNKIHNQEEIILYFIDTLSFEGTINKFGISKASLIYYLQKNNLSKIKNNVDYDRIDEVILQNYNIATVSQMAIMANCSRTVIQNRRKDFGLVRTTYSEDEIIKDFKAGVSKAELTRRYNCSKYKLNKILEKHLKNSDNNYYTDKLTVEDIIKNNINLNNVELGKLAGCSSKTIQRYKKKMAI